MMSPTGLRTPSRQSFHRPTISTDVSMYNMTLASPITPYVELASTPTATSPVTDNWDLCVAQEDQTTRLRVPIHLVLPLVVSDDSHLSRLYSDYLRGARQMLESGVPLSDVVGQDDDVAVDLFFRGRLGNDKFDCASWACEVCRSYHNTDKYIRLATACLLTFMMRVS